MLCASMLSNLLNRLPILLWMLLVRQGVKNCREPKVPQTDTCFPRMRCGQYLGQQNEPPPPDEWASYQSPLFEHPWITCNLILMPSLLKKQPLKGSFLKECLTWPIQFLDKTSYAKLLRLPNQYYNYKNSIIVLFYFVVSGIFSELLHYYQLITYKTLIWIKLQILLMFNYGYVWKEFLKLGKNLRKWM